MQVVQDNMKLSCRCHGFSGSCAVKTCWRELPSLHEIGDKIREKYDSAVKVESHIPRDGGPARLQYFSTETRGHSIPSNNDLVFLKLSPSYCSIHQNYTLGRYCVPRANLTEELQGHYSPCEDLCCTREYYTRHHTVTYSCNCTFRWCCEVMCQTCVEDITKYLCTGWRLYTDDEVHSMRCSALQTAIFISTIIIIQPLKNVWCAAYTCNGIFIHLKCMSACIELLIHVLFAVGVCFRSFPPTVCQFVW